MAAKGLTLVELMIGMVVASILLTIGIVTLVPNDARRYANDFKALVQRARYHAIAHNEPVAVVWSESIQQFSVLYDAKKQGVGVHDICTSEDSLQKLEAKDYPRVVVSQSIIRGIVWLPSGLGRSCSNTIYNDTVTFEQGSRRVDVKISRAGRVYIP